MQLNMGSPKATLLFLTGALLLGGACAGSDAESHDEAAMEANGGRTSVERGGVAGHSDSGAGPGVGGGGRGGEAGAGRPNGAMPTAGTGAVATDIGRSSAGAVAVAGSGGMQAAVAGMVAGMGPSENMPAGRGGEGALAGAGGGPDASAAGAPAAEGDDGFISIDDSVPGFAGVAGGTTGGGNELARAISVSTMGELRAATSGSAPAIVLVQPGTYAGALSPGANKTILGVSPGVKIVGNINISGADRSNIIVRNLAVQGERCASYEACKSGADGVYVGNGAHHVWLDHLDIADGQDGNCDITQGGDYVTVSWTHFHYTYDKEHRFSNLIAGSDDEPASVGKLHITYMRSHWAERIDQRQPRGRFGNIHMLNNYHSTGGSQIHGVGKDMALIAENSVYQERISIWTDMGSPRGWKGIGNIGTAQDLNASRGTVFEIPYEYTALPAEEVVAVLTRAKCGAGNTCELAR